MKEFERSVVLSQEDLDRLAYIHKHEMKYGWGDRLPTFDKTISHAIEMLYILKQDQADDPEYRKDCRLMQKKYGKNKKHVSEKQT